MQKGGKYKIISGHRRKFAHKSRDTLSEAESGRQIQRYIRLTYLIPELLQNVDEGWIAFTPAVELSYLTQQEQQTLLSEMEYADCPPRCPKPFACTS